MAEQKRQWTELKTDALWDELKLFLRSLIPGRFKDRASRNQKPKCWPERCDAWETHVTLFARIECGTGEGAASWKTTRIKFLFDHLNILDTKFGILLTFNSVLLIAINVLINILFNLLKDKGSTPIYTAWIVLLSLAFGLVWLLTTILCLWGERRLVWGDLGLISQDDFVWWKRKFRHEHRLTLENINQSDLESAEKRHVDALIIAVV